MLKRSLLIYWLQGYDFFVFMIFSSFDIECLCFYFLPLPPHDVQSPFVQLGHFIYLLVKVSKFGGQDIIMVVSFPHLSIDRKHCPKCDSCFGQLNSRAWATAEYIASNRKDHVYSFCMRWILGCLL